MRESAWWIKNHSMVDLLTFIKRNIESELQSAIADREVHGGQSVSSEENYLALPIIAIWKVTVYRRT